MEGFLEDLSDIAARIYIHLLLSREPKGVREISRELGISVSTVHYNLRKLEDRGLVKRDRSGGYTVASVIPLKGFIIVGRRLIHKFLIYSLFFLGVVIGEFTRITVFGASIENSILTITVSLIGFGLFLYEALKIYRNMLTTHSNNK